MGEVTAAVAVAGVSVDLAAVGRAGRVILVEGRSDKAAVEVLAARRGMVLGGAGLQVVAMGGVTSIGHFLAALGPHGINVILSGLCDAGQESYVRWALERGGLGASASRAELEALGFYVCAADLEDELIRAVGIGAVEQVIEGQGELRSFRRSSGSRSSDSAARPISCTGSWGPGQAGRASTPACWRQRQLTWTASPARWRACSRTDDGLPLRATRAESHPH